jgi:hypothetical protein
MPTLFVTSSEAAGAALRHKKSETIKNENGKNLLSILDPFILLATVKILNFHESFPAFKLKDKNFNSRRVA